MQRSRLLTVFAIVLVDLLGFGLIVPLVPFFAEDFGVGRIVQGSLIACYAAAQFVGAPILGRLSDRYGRRPVLLVSIFGSAVGFVMLGVANTLWLLFASRLLDGVTGGNISVAQSYITDITDEENRAKGLGLVGAAFGLGFVLGPASGAFLSSLGRNIELLGLNWRFALPALFATTLAMANLVAVYFLLPETLSDEQKAQAKADTNAGRVLDLTQYVTALRRPDIGVLLSTRFVFGLAFAILQLAFPLYASERFNLDERQTGYILAYIGLLIVIVQGALIGRITSRWDDGPLIKFSVIVMSISLFIWGIAPSIPILLLIMVPVALSGGIFNTVINTALTKAVATREVGEVLGLGAGLESMTRIIAPVMGGALIQWINSAAPGIVASLILVPLIWVIYQRT